MCKKGVVPAEVRGGTKSPGTGVKDGSCELSLGPLKEQSPVFFKLVVLVIRIQDSEHSRQVLYC